MKRWNPVHKGTEDNIIKHRQRIGPRFSRWHCFTRKARRPILLSRQGTVRHTPVQYDVHCTYGMVQLHTSGRYNIRRYVTKLGRYKNVTVHDFSLWRNAKCSVKWCVVVVQYTKIVSRPDVCTVRAYVLSRRLYVPADVACLAVTG